MTAKQKRPPARDVHIEGCNFDARMSEGQVEVLTTSAEVLLVQARAALTLIEALRGHNGPMIQFGGPT